MVMIYRINAYIKVFTYAMLSISKFMKFMCEQNCCNWQILHNTFLLRSNYYKYNTITNSYSPSDIGTLWIF